MQPTPIIQIDLDQSPAERWRRISRYRSCVTELCSYYAGELIDDDEGRALVQMYAQQYVPHEYRQEMAGIAHVCDTPISDILVANLYYDALKHVFGGTLACSALAVETPAGPIHARNFDWHGPEDLLSRATIIVDLVEGKTTRARLVTWPGFVGALSGMVPGKFSVSLNAVLSDESPGLAPAVTFVLRDLLERGVTYDEAVATLESVEVASDSLLMVVGTNRGERVVIERTPIKSHIRRADGPLVVTNNYVCLEGVLNSGVLAATACARFDRALDLSSAISTCKDAFTVLSDNGVKMEITVQQMAFCPMTGELYVNGLRVP